MLLNFGKYNGTDISELIHSNPLYCKWLYTQPFIKEKTELFNILESKFKDLDSNYLTFGKYKNKTIKEVNIIDPKYLNWLLNNNYVKEKLDDIIEEINEINKKKIEK